MTSQRQFEEGQVRVRGTQDGLLLQLPASVPFPAVLGQVRGQIDGNGDFFRKAEIVIDFAHREPNVEEIAALTTLLADRQVKLRAVTSSVPSHRELLRSWGHHPLRIAARDALPDRSDHLETVVASTVDRAARYVRRTLRSGNSVSSEGDVVVLGDVNAGSEVVAAGDVIVWGAIRGTVHAGASGDHHAIICALRLTPTQLRIGRIFARPPDHQESRSEGPLIARVENGEIVVEPWRADRRIGR